MRAAIPIVIMLFLVPAVAGLTLQAGDRAVMGAGESVSVPVIVDSVPAGLAGYNLSVSLSDPDVAEIGTVVFPDWAVLNGTSVLPSGSAWMKAVDLYESVDPGAVNVTIATVPLTAKKAGKTAVNLSVRLMSGDNGDTLSLAVLNGSLSVGTGPTGPLPNNRHIFVNVANSDGVKYDRDGAAYGGPENTYYIKADGGGLNELHITADPAAAYGQVTTTTNQSGMFWLTNTGGRGFDDDIVILVAVNGTIPDDFALRIRSSGYSWTPAPRAAATPPPPTDYRYVAGAVDETFTKEDFVYGPQTWKPGPGILGEPSLPVYYGQDMSDGNDTFRLMFVDLKVGNLAPSKFPGVDLTDNGGAKVEFEFSGHTTFAAFNGYGWCSAANQDQGISWTNRVSDYGSSGYTVSGVPFPFSLRLHPGWNLVSVPVRLADGHRTAAAVFSGIQTGGHSLFSYEAGTRSWRQVTGADEMEPLRAVWVYSVPEAEIPLVFDGASPQDRALFTGWNLIGFAGKSPEAARDFLLPVQDNWTTAIGFDAVLQHYDTSIIRGGSGSHSDGTLLSPGRGYWLYMTGPGSLGA